MHVVVKTESNISNNLLFQLLIRHSFHSKEKQTYKMNSLSAFYDLEDSLFFQDEFGSPMNFYLSIPDKEEEESCGILIMFYGGIVKEWPGPHTFFMTYAFQAEYPGTQYRMEYIYHVSQQQRKINIADYIFTDTTFDGVAETFQNLKLL